MATQSNKPVTTLRCGAIKATIWRNASEKGEFYNTIFARSYMDAHGEWKDSAAFGLADLEALVVLVTQAKTWIGEQSEQ